MKKNDKIKNGYVPYDLTPPDHYHWDHAKRMTFPNLKPSGISISLRLPLSMLNELKIMANKLDVPYQSLIKMILSERIKEGYLKVA